MEIPGGRGVIKDPLGTEIPRVGGGVQTKNLLWEGYGYFLEPTLKAVSLIEPIVCKCFVCWDVDGFRQLVCSTIFFQFADENPTDAYQRWWHFGVLWCHYAFTNIPVDQTIHILANKAFTNDWFNKTHSLSIEERTTTWTPGSSSERPALLVWRLALLANWQRGHGFTSRTTTS